MKLRKLIASFVLGELIAASSLLPFSAWAGDNITSDILLTVSALPTCNADTSAMTFDLGTVDTPQQEPSQTQVIKLSCNAQGKVTLQGYLQRDGDAQAGGEIASLKGCENAGQGTCFDLIQTGHTFDVAATGTNIGIRVAYRVPDGLGKDTFTGQLTLSWP